MRQSRGVSTCLRAADFRELARAPMAIHSTGGSLQLECTRTSECGPIKAASSKDERKCCITSPIAFSLKTTFHSMFFFISPTQSINAEKCVCDYKTTLIIIKQNRVNLKIIVAMKMHEKSQVMKRNLYHLLASELVLSLTDIYNIPSIKKIMFSQFSCLFHSIPCFLQ